MRSSGGVGQKRGVMTYIVAVRKSEPLRELHIEAKGETSSRRGSGRYGSPFSSAQIRVHVAEALYKAAEILSGNYEVVTISLKDVDTEVRAGVALPDTGGHRRCIANITAVLEQLGIAVFWVQKNGDVQVVAPWEV